MCSSESEYDVANHIEYKAKITMTYVKREEDGTTYGDITAKTPVDEKTVSLAEDPSNKRINVSGSKAGVSGTFPCNGIYNKGVVDGYDACWDTISMNHTTDQVITPEGSVTFIPGGKRTPTGEYTSKNTIKPKVTVDTTGWTKGVFTRAALTLQGTNVSLTLQGDETKVTTLGDAISGSGTNIGGEVKFKHYGTWKLFYQDSEGNYKSAGEHDWYYESSSGSAVYYKKGSDYSYSGFKKGKEEIYYKQGKVANDYYASGTSYTSENSPYYTKS